MNVGLILKDLLVLRKQAKLYLLVLAFYLVMTQMNVFDSSMLTGFTTLLIIMMPLTSFAYDELARWNKYAVTLPGGRQGLVRSKYLLVLVLVVIGVTLVNLGGLLLWVLGSDSVSPLFHLVTSLVCGGVGLLINAFVLPLIFRFGTEKARILLLLLFGGAFVAGTTLASRLGNMVGNFQPGPPFVLGAVVGLLVLYYLSYSVSLSIVNKKDF